MQGPSGALHIKGLPPEDEDNLDTNYEKKDSKKSESEEAAVIDPEKFEQRLLMKPSSLSSKQGANNLKMIIKGKHIIFDDEDDSSNSPGIRRKNDATVAKLGSEKKRKRDQLEDIDISQPMPPDESDKIDSSRIPLPPVHHYPPLPRPIQNFDLPSILQKLLKSTSSLSKPLFRFDVLQEAAIFNWKLLESTKFDLNPLLNTPSTCVTSFGSEFKPVQELEELLFQHPRWKSLKKTLTEGAHFPLTDLPEDSRIRDLKLQYIRGNHKSAEKNEEHLSSFFSADL